LAFEPDKSVPNDASIVSVNVPEGTTRLYHASYLCFGTTEVERRTAAKLVKVKTASHCIIFPVGKIAEKVVCSLCIFDNVAALYFECRINKNALHQTPSLFLAILPTGLGVQISHILIFGNFGD